MEMVINLARYRTAIICGLACLLLAWLAAGGINPEKPADEKEQPHLESSQECGEFLTWTEVKGIFPRYARATITDYETGKSFRVQRRAGSGHADVQPLTAGDTAVMKEIYHGKWSWRRRAVIVTLDNGSRIAASMAGMPHGSGAIRGNRFNGHFCLHFRDSRTHGSNQVDTAHQMMIWKAAGVLDKRLAAMPPAELVTSFFTALNQGDAPMASGMVSAAQQNKLAEDIKSIQSIKTESIQQLSAISFQVSLRIQYMGNSRMLSRHGQVLLIPTSSGWRINYPSVQPWLRPAPL